MTLNQDWHSCWYSKLLKPISCRLDYSFPTTAASFPKGPRFEEPKARKASSFPYHTFLYQHNISGGLYMRYLKQKGAPFNLKKPHRAAEVRKQDCVGRLLSLTRNLSGVVLGRCTSWRTWPS